MSPTPTYDDGSGLALCSASNVQSQGYRVSGELLTTSTAPEVGIATSFAAPARLGNGGIVLTGGIRNLTFTPMTTGALFTLTGSIAGPTQSLGIGRFMHAAAGFHKEGVLLVGGATSVNGMLVLAGGAHASQL